MGIDLHSGPLRRYLQQALDNAFLRQWQTEAANEVKIIDTEGVG
jgi:hypothetical protein